MSSVPETSDDRDLLAAELALGLLEAGERTTAEARLVTDAAFAASFLRWQHHAAGLLDGTDEPPSAAVWEKIAARLPANDAREPVPVSRLRRWQALAAAAAVAAVALAIHPLRPPETRREVAIVRPTQPPLVAVLSGEKRSDVVTVSIDATRQRLFVRSAALDPGKGDAQLWVVPASGTPVSLGLIDPAARRTLPVAVTLRPALAAGATLAVSLEPRGGSPTGLPTGPVILSGKIAQS